MTHAEAITHCAPAGVRLLWQLRPDSSEARREESALLAAIKYPNIDPVALRIGPMEVRWYGIAYLAGFALATSGSVA